MVPYQMQKLCSIDLHRHSAVQLMSFEGNVKKNVMMAGPGQELYHLHCNAW